MLKDAPAPQVLEAAITSNPDDLRARHLLGALRLVDGDAEAGLEQFLEMLRRDRNFDDGLPRKALIDAFRVVEDEDLVGRYRRKMSSLLFLRLPRAAGRSSADAAFARGGKRTHPYGRLCASHDPAPVRMKASVLRRGLNVWPPFLFAGIRVHAAPTTAATPVSSCARAGGTATTSAPISAAACSR